MFERGVFSFQPALFPYPNYKRASSALSHLCHAFVFSRLLTLSFFIAPLCRITAIACALFRKKPGGIPPARSNHFPLRHPFSLRYSPLATALISFISPRYENSLRKSFPSPTYAKTGGWLPPAKCRRADIFDFSPDFSHFFSSTSQRRSASAPTKEQEGWLRSPALHFGNRKKREEQNARV
jgi:hypothetical protein